MRLVFPLLNEPFDLRDDMVNQIIFESPTIMFSFVNQIYEQINKHDGDIILSEKDKLIDISKVIDLTTDYFPFDINRKALVSKLQSFLKMYAVSEYTLELDELVSCVSRFLSELSERTEFLVDYDDIDVSGLLKIANVRFSVESDRLIEQVVDYCKSTVNLCGEKLFIFVSLRNYISEEEFYDFRKMVVDNKLRVLLIEAIERGADGLNNLIIDRDLCVI